jgi:hypothetical protein
MDALPSPPAGLRASGRRLWADVVGRYVLTAGELEILRQAAHTCDEADKLERELRRMPLMVAGYAGQPRPNPLLKVLQDHRLLIRRLVDSLNLPDESEAVGLRPGQRHAAKAAHARWNREVS